MPIHIQAPDGSIAEFPDGTPDATITSVMAKTFGGPKPAAPKPPPQSATQAVTGFMANVNRGLGIGDELAAGFKTAGNVFAGKVPIQRDQSGHGNFDQAVTADFQRNMALQRQTENSFSQAHPHVAALARGTGMAATAAFPAGDTANALAQAPRAVNMARGATTAGLTAAGYAAADAGTPAERLKAASQAATNPVVLALGAAGGALAPSAKALKPSPVNIAELKAQKTAAYKAVDDMGAAFTPQSVKDLAQGISDEASAANISPTRHPIASSMVDEIRTRLSGDQPITMTQLDQLRQEIGRDVASAKEKSERFFGQKMIRNIDDFINSAGPEQVIGADPQAAAQAISAARDMNSRYMKASAVAQARTSAEYRAGATGSGGNVNNATRQNLAKLVDPGSRKQIRNLTPDETNALNTAVLGTAQQNQLRQAGKLSPEGNGLMLAGHLAMSAQTHGLSTLAAIGGALSKRIADRQTAAQVEDLIRLMANGGSATTSNAERQLAFMATKDPQVAAVYRDVRAQMARAAGVGGNVFSQNASPAQ